MAACPTISHNNTPVRSPAQLLFPLRSLSGTHEPANFLQSDKSLWCWELCLNTKQQGAGQATKVILSDARRDDHVILLVTHKRSIKMDLRLSFWGRKTTLCCFKKKVVGMKSKWRCPTSVWCLPCAWQPFPLVSASRWLKKRGELAISSEELSIWRAFSHRSNYLFLFNDVLIVTRKKRSVVMNYGQLHNI